MQYREIYTIIDSAKGTLISPDGAKISRDDLLPRLILADEVIFYASFVNVREENNVISVEPKIFDSSLAFKIIGDIDNDSETPVMFSYAYLPEKSDLASGKLAFHIKSNSTRFAEALNNTRSKKCEFVILGLGADPVSTVVLAKDQFIAENRPCENAVFEDIDPSEMMTKEEMQLLLDLKSPLNHTHDEYALTDHTHKIADITDWSGTDGGTVTPVYTAGTGIEITEDNVINCTVESNTESVTYTAGSGISISDGVISCTVSAPSYTAGTGISISNGVISCTQTVPSYTAGTGISISNSVISCTVSAPRYTAGTGISIENGVIACTLSVPSYLAGTGISILNGYISCTLDVPTDYVTEETFYETIGNIDYVLDRINGEEV